MHRHPILTLQLRWMGMAKHVRLTMFAVRTLRQNLTLTWSIKEMKCAHASLPVPLQKIVTGVIAS